MNTLNLQNALHDCPYRLPCGICEKLKEKCPVQNTVNYCTSDLASTYSSLTATGTVVKRNEVN